MKQNFSSRAQTLFLCKNQNEECISLFSSSPVRGATELGYVILNTLSMTGNSTSKTGSMPEQYVIKTSCQGGCMWGEIQHTYTDVEDLAPPSYLHMVCVEGSRRATWIDLHITDINGALHHEYCTSKYTSGNNSALAGGTD